MGLVVAEVCSLKQLLPVLCMCGLPMVWSMSSCALPVTVQHAICKLEARHVFQVAQGRLQRAVPGHSLWAAPSFQLQLFLPIQSRVDRLSCAMRQHT